MNTTVGLDIGSHSIKLIELAREGDQIALIAAGSMPTPPKAMSSTLRPDLEAVAVALDRKSVV
jgi:Tfp pilus assembly PilM family ATPase